jgi:TPR repeat protein
MKRILMMATMAMLAAGNANALEQISHAAGMDTYDTALKSYSCVDYDKAYRLFQGNAEKGHALSQYMMGVMLSAGQGASEDDKAAFNWFMRAAEQNLADAYYALGDMLKKGEGVEKDDVQALFWFKLAADSGHSLAKDMVVNMTPTMAKTQMDQIIQKMRDWTARLSP